MAVSMLMERLTKNLECAVCLDTYDDPRMLKCQHSYCKRCLEKIVVIVGHTQKVTCPECRQKIKLGWTGVAGLPTNLLINDLLRLSSTNTDNASPSCDKHNDELMELYCEACDEPICHACLVIDHRDHSYTSIKDVFPGKKREIVKLMKDAKSKVSALRAEVFSIEAEENKVRENDAAVSREIDTLIDATINKHTAVMERERQRLKEEVHAKCKLQLSKLHDRKESLAKSLSSVEVAQQSVDCENKVKFLRSKKEIARNLTDLHSLVGDFHPCENVVYELDRKSLGEEKMQGIGKIKAQSEYCLSMAGGEPGVIYTGRVWQWREFVLTVNSDEASHQRNVLDDFKVTILAPNKDTPVPFSLEDKGNGSRGFGWRPGVSGDHKISIFNEKLFGGEALCSPVIWEVLPPFYLKTWVFLPSIFHLFTGVRSYTYLSNCVFEDGQHSWAVRMLRPSEARDYSHKDIQIGVTHPFSDGAWYWQNAQHISAGNCTASSITSLQRYDVFVCFLDLFKRQFTIYNERTKESDIWRDIDAPVRPHLSPDAFLLAYFEVQF
ncbi:tripartite motif-containing protein 3-like [Montipora foliosa]|uniref:tripartite motif-containing protein 3-like n=1 Tax=Montipora foliosa TaxID=591990 RepID=UPI0035F207DB